MVRAPAIDDDFLGEHHVYEPHRAGFPPFRRYFRELWRRREFALYLARTNLQAENFDTVFGKVWLVLNPVLLGVVYFVLIYILGGGHGGGELVKDGEVYVITPSLRFAHLLAGLFLYYFLSGAISSGAKSVTSGGRLILNMAFPRSLLPLSSTAMAFRRFLPTLLVLVVVGVVVGLPLSPVTLLAVPIVVLVALFAHGVSMIFATAQVYFRDTASFLPYFLRIWLYLSPVLFFAEQIPAALSQIAKFNPLYWMLGAWSDVLILGIVPSLKTWALSVAFAVSTLVIGQLLFMSRERDFAVRL